MARESHNTDNTAPATPNSKLENGVGIPVSQFWLRVAPVGLDRDHQGVRAGLGVKTRCRPSAY